MAWTSRVPTKSFTSIHNENFFRSFGIVFFMTLCAYAKEGRARAMDFENASRHLVTDVPSLLQSSPVPSVLGQSRISTSSEQASQPARQHPFPKDLFHKLLESNGSGTAFTASNILIDRDLHFTTESNDVEDNPQGAGASSTTQLSEQDEVADIKIFYENCSVFEYRSLFYKKGSIHGVFGNASAFRSNVNCKWCLHVPQGFQHILVSILMPEEPCLDYYSIHVSSSPQMLQNHEYSFTCNFGSRQIFGEANKSLYFDLHLKLENRKKLDKISGVEIKNPVITVEFEAYKEDVRTHLNVDYETPHSGYITQWGYDGSTFYLCTNNASLTLMLPREHVVMLSFSRFDMNYNVQNDCPHVGLWIYSADRMQTLTLLVHHCGEKAIAAEVYVASLLFHFMTHKFCNNGGLGFKAFFSFHTAANTPQKLENGLFNCSTPTYHRFKKHLECNLDNECNSHRDEGEHCPYSNSYCKGLVSSGGKCYSYVAWGKPLSFHVAQKECLKRNGDLAMMKTNSEWNDFAKIFEYGKSFRVSWIGVRSGDSSLPDIYKYVMKWVDNSIAHTAHVISDVHNHINYLTSYHRNFELCGLIYKQQKVFVDFGKCVSHEADYFFCQHGSEQKQKANMTFPEMLFPFSRIKNTSLWLHPCGRGHVAHAFMSCDWNSQCESEDMHREECQLSVSRKVVSLFATTMFECKDRTMTLHYTLVCDFRHDCRDSSDESLCVHAHNCTGFLCNNGQCVEGEKRCDWDKDCLDESDELLCDDEVNPKKTKYIFPQVYRLPPPVLIDFSQERTIIQMPLGDNDPCPNTHFQCSQGYCLPIYLLCNGVVDCPGDEDEMECHVHRCPGYYRCRSSSVCVHVDHLCDGQPQCPQRDDEWLCSMVCPDQCLCQGHAFCCPKDFNVISYPQLRYLDASASGMKPQDVTGVLYLVWLSLAMCKVQQVPQIYLPNLRLFDLSHNLISSLRIFVFLTLQNLENLVLSNNPIVHISVGKFIVNQTRVHTLDLSHTLLSSFSSQKISSFPKLRHLNLSFNKIDIIMESGFSKIPHLQSVDLRGNPLSSYPFELLKDHTNLQSVFTDDYRLCCKQSLPRLLVTGIQCISPKTHFSSCEDLMHYSEHRVLMFVVMFLAVVGNATSLVLKLCIRRNALSSPIDFLMTNINLMDLMMGVYSTVVVVADWIYRQRYFSVRHFWTSSMTCKATGVVALISYEGTLFILCFMSIHGFMTTHSWKLATNVTLRVVFIVCILIWFLAIVISLIPLSVTTWKFHGYTDNCFPVPTSIASEAGRVYAFAAMVILHLIVSPVTCMWQLSVLWLKYFRDDLNLSITERSVKIAEASRSLPMIALDCVRRLFFCLMVLMGQVGLVTPEKIQSVYSMLVVPVNSAINPLLYVLGDLHEKKRQRAEQRLLQRLARLLVHRRDPH